MKDYYKILEIDKNASPEIIKVAYKLLVKKYHPDLKEGVEKKQAEEKIKEINEAYDVLSNSFKKSDYDKIISSDNFTQERYQKILNENLSLKKELNYFKSMYYRYNNKSTYAETPHKKNMYDTSEPPNNSQKNTNSSNKYYNVIKNIFSNFDESIKTLIAISISFLIVIIFLQIPFLRDLFSIILSDGYIFIIILIVTFYIFYYKNKQ